MKKIILLLILLVFIIGCAQKIDEELKEKPIEKIPKEVIIEKESEEKIQPENLQEEIPEEEIKEIPSSYHIQDVPIYQENNFCYGASAMMLAKYAGLTEQEVQEFKTAIKSGKGGPPDMFNGFRELDMIDKVRIGYSKNYVKEYANFYNSQVLTNPKEQTTLFENKNEAFENLKQLISSNTPVIILIHSGNHYVVATGYNEKYVYTNDPGYDDGYTYKIDSDPNLKQRRIATNDFLAEWTIKSFEGGGIGFPGDYGMIWLEKTQKEQQSIIQTKNLIEGKTLSERLNILKAHLHTEGSGDEAKKLFPDFVKVYVDDGSHNKYFVSVSPFTYYYSEEADITVSICNIGYTVFICGGKLDRLIKESDYDECKITDAYLHPEKYS